MPFSLTPCFSWYQKQARLGRGSDCVCNVKTSYIFDINCFQIQTYGFEPKKEQISFLNRTCLSKELFYKLSQNSLLSWVSCTLWNYVCLKLKEAVYGKQHQLAQCRATAKVCKGKNGWQMRNWELPTTILPWFSTRANHNKCNVKSLLLWNMAINSRIELLHATTLF